ncbi:MAG: hypothetical protein KDK36_19260 [Leptospiraceae bacterium]|nr:hypothetical protein [Leptospiraceae bacterium]
MAIDKRVKAEFDKNLTEFKSYIEDLKKEVSLYKIQMKKNKQLEPYYQIAIVLNSLRLMNTCVCINDLSMHILKLKSEIYLNIARKEIYSIFTAMEKVVGSDYENGLDENRELLDAIEEFDPKQRLNFLKGYRKVINDIIDAYGSNSKWKWSWPELHFKLAVLSKNLFDFRAFQKDNDLDNPFYYVRREHYSIILELANHAAQEYRSKFDLSTNDSADLKKCIMIFEMLRKIYQMTGDTEDLTKTKTLIESLTAKINSIEGDKTKGKKRK